MSCSPNQSATPTNGSAATQRYAARRKRAWRRGETPSGFVPAFSPDVAERGRDCVFQPISVIQIGFAPSPWSAITAWTSR